MNSASSLRNCRILKINWRMFLVLGRDWQISHRSLVFVNCESILYSTTVQQVQEVQRSQCSLCSKAVQQVQEVQHSQCSLCRTAVQQVQPCGAATPLAHPLLNMELKTPIPTSQPRNSQCRDAFFKNNKISVT